MVFRERILINFMLHLTLQNGHLTLHLCLTLHRTQNTEDAEHRHSYFPHLNEMSASRNLQLFVQVHLIQTFKSNRLNE